MKLIERVKRVSEEKKNKLEPMMSHTGMINPKAHAVAVSCRNDKILQTICQTRNLPYRFICSKISIKLIEREGKREGERVQEWNRIGMKIM